MLPRYFASRIEGVPHEAQTFAELVAKTLSLSRSDFQSVMSALRAFSGALEVVGSSLDLAYSMLVYALESLAQKYVHHQPQWPDYDQRTRAKLEPILAALPSEQANGIKAALLDHAHLKLRARFLEFICTHVEDSYFTSSAPLSFPLQKSELRRAARNIYDVRSAYVHELVPLLDQLRVPQIAEGEVFRWELEPHLTFNGLVRLSDHVIRTLISRLPSVEKEDFAWRSALPGIVRLQMAPQYWIHQVGGFEPATAHRYFEGFLSHFTETGLQGEPICDMSAIMEKIEQVGGQGKPEHQRAMLALYSLYNMCLRSDLRRPDWELFLEKHQAIVDQPAIELMATRVVLDGGFPWTYAEGAAALASHESTRFHRGVFHPPLAVEIALMVAVANQALREGLPDAHASMVRTALLNSSGRPPLQAALQKALEAPQEIEIEQVLLRKPSPKPSPIDDVGL